MFIALLGRQPEISLAELEAVFGVKSVQKIADNFAQIDTKQFNINELGGTVKCAKIVKELPLGKNHKTSLLTASNFINNYYGKKWRHQRSEEHTSELQSQY